MTEADPELQAIVAQAAAALAAPMALVCLESRRGPRLHAQLGIVAAEGGLADDAAARCESCGPVEVPDDDAPFEVRDVRHDARVPRALLARHEVRACLGAPVRVGGEARGVLCVMDRVERGFTPEDHATLAGLAARASRRLAHLAVAPAHGYRNLLERATGPAFGEIRNLLNPMRLNLAVVRATVSDLGPLLDALESRAANAPEPPPPRAATRPRRTAYDTLERLHASFASFEDEVKHLQDVVLAVEAAVTNERSTALHEVVGVASQLAHHMTKLVGGLRWAGPTPQAQLALSRSVAVSAVAATISCMASWLLARRASPGLRGWFEDAPNTPLRVLIAPAVPAADCVAECTRDLGALLADEPLVAARTFRDALCLELPRP